MTPTNRLAENKKWLASQCNRHINGLCQTLVCLQRGGYKSGEEGPIDYDIATCEPYELLTLLDEQKEDADMRTFTQAANAAVVTRLEQEEHADRLAEIENNLIRSDRAYTAEDGIADVKYLLALLDEKEALLKATLTSAEAAESAYSELAEKCKELERENVTKCSACGNEAVDHNGYLTCECAEPLATERLRAIWLEAERDALKARLAEKERENAYDKQLVENTNAALRKTQDSLLAARDENATLAAEVAALREAIASLDHSREGG